MRRLSLLFFCAAVFAVKVKAEIVNTALINQPAPKFSLKGMDGKTVSLSDYKGKILVLDFWATWCVPCRNSFPAMKKVVEKYKNAPSVKFLFIDTRETALNYKTLVRKFLNQHHYPFYTVFDEKSDDGKMNAMFKQYVMPGIPTKYFIDKNGAIRFQRVGFMPGQTIRDAAGEIEDFIEKTKSAG